MAAEPGLEDTFRLRVEESIATKRRLLDDLSACLDVARDLVEAYRRGNVMLLFGNGGSAADAQHIAAEFSGRFYLDRRPLAAHALTVNTSALTAIGNDYSFEQVFARQVEALGRPGDVAIGLSTSGRSANVVTALRVAREAGLITVAMTGIDGASAAGVAEHSVRVPSTDVARVQEAHILIGHVWSEIVERALFTGA